MRYRALTAICLAILVLAPAAHARSSYRTAFRTQYNATYGVTGSRIDNCTLCHPGGDTGQFNNYANAFATAKSGHTVAQGFTAIEVSTVMGMVTPISRKSPHSPTPVTRRIIPLPRRAH